jgi:large subunit ribosomal protein L31
MHSVAAQQRCIDEYQSNPGVVMKKGIHPNYMEATVSCACGNSFQTLSIKPLLKIDVCSNCHPFFTGQQRILDTAGRVERFRKRFNLQEEE